MKRIIKNNKELYISRNDLANKHKNNLESKSNNIHKVNIKQDFKIKPNGYIEFSNAK